MHLTCPFDNMCVSIDGRALFSILAERDADQIRSKCDKE